MKTRAAEMLFDMVLVALLLVVTPPATQALNIHRDLSGLVGETIIMPCAIDLEKCGSMHSIKWYRGSSRIFVFSENPTISRAEGDYEERAILHYVANSTNTSLEVKSLQVADEAVYKCEITYIEVRAACSVVQFINLTALIKPEYLRISRGDGSELQNSTVIGPFVEGTELTLLCESGGGKPIPSVSWWNGTSKMTGDYSAENGGNSVGTGRNRVQLTLGRGDLSAKYECRANSEALEAPMVSWIEVDVNVRPSKLSLTGVSHHVVQGSRVVLECLVAGARPAANVTWWNGTEAMVEEKDTSIDTNSAVQTGPRTRVVDASDGTYETQSQLIFTASRYENGETLTCEATNQVLVDKEEKPMKEFITLEVLYPPIVSVSPGNITVNESTDIVLFCAYEANPSSLKTVKWMRDGQEVNSKSDHFEGSTVDQTALKIKNATRYDQGVYTCVLENDVGAEESDDVVYVSVYFPPIVRLTMDPPTPVRELDRLNITLMCKVESGNPDLLLSVRWYLDGELLKELPDCGNATQGAIGGSGAGLENTFCDIDPSKLLLEVVGRSFHGNYSCEGQNEAGWGPLSAEEELTVYYPPSAASLVFAPARVVKRSSVTLSCSVEDIGRPDTTTFRWLRGAHLIQDITTANWTIDPVTLETESNFTCLAHNEGGEGDPATVYIEVFAPPLFIERLPPYTGALLSAQHINVSCRVECSPWCAVHWLKNDQMLHLGDSDASNAQYTVRNTVVPPDTRSNDFESVLSTLVWNMSAWPGGQLDRVHDNANYTCQSSGNPVGVGVKSTTVFGVEYPPEKIAVSNAVVNVIEGFVPEKVLCSAKGYPEATYVWRQDGKREVIVKGNALSLNYAMQRRNGGHYVCEASNRHGSIVQKTYINVLYKPECGITQTEQDGKLVLICTAHANPTDVDFTWRIKAENDTVDENVEKKGLQSFLTLETRVENFRTYLCFANNTVGMSIPCERDVTGHIGGWWGKLDNDNLIIIIAVIIGAILMVLVVCVIIIIVCRRKRAEDKYNNPVEMEERENGYERFVMNLQMPPTTPEGDSSDSTAVRNGSASGPVHKWPLRPGVLVHVNGAHSLSAARLPTAASTPCARVSGRKQRAVVVTFKKLDGPIMNGASRKRKKPGTDPNQSATKDKSMQDLGGSPDDLLQPDGDKAFYENLPFLGIQPPPNKSPAPPPPRTASPPIASRPASQLSQYASSGYGSTRSRAAPLSLELADAQPDKCHSLRTRAKRQPYPQFYSLRLRKRDKCNGECQKERQVFHLHALPITESPPEAIKVAETNNNVEVEKRRAVPPVPAPRTYSAASLPRARHTYMNVPLGKTTPVDTEHVQPFKPEFSDLDYADVDYRSYGPINYKMASIQAAAQLQNNNNYGPAKSGRSPSPDLL